MVFGVLCSGAPVQGLIMVIIIAPTAPTKHIGEKRTFATVKI
jgi:hypothetical protein